TSVNADAEKAAVYDTDPGWTQGSITGGRDLMHIKPETICRLFCDSAGGLKIHAASGRAFLNKRPKRDAIGRVAVSGESGIEAVLIAPGIVTPGVTFRRARIFETTVADQLAVEPAVHAMINFLQEYAVHARVD